MKRKIILTGCVWLALVTAGYAAETVRGNPAGTGKALEQGMTAGQVIELVGQPASVRPMKTAAGSAEIWTYRRIVRDRVNQNAATATMIPAFRGVNGDGSPNIGPTPELEYHLERVRDSQVTALLMVDGKLVMGRQWFERERNIEQ